MKLERHNFSKPSKLAGDLEQRLLAWFNVAVVMAPKKWAKDLPFPLGVTCGSLDTVRPAEVLPQLPDETVAFIVTLGPAMTLFTFPRSLVLAVVAGLLGDATGALPADRELTTVDEDLFQYFFEDFLLPALEETWPGTDPLALNYVRREPNVRYTRAFAETGNMIACSFNFCGPFGEMTCQWLVPTKGILALMGEAPQHKGEPTSQKTAPSPNIKQLVQDCPIEVSVVLGTADLSLVQLARLVIGDTVILNQSVAEPLLASVGGEEKFRGWAGRIGSLQAFQIQSVTDTD